MKRNNPLLNLTVRNKMILAFFLPTVLLIIINLFLYSNTNRMLKALDTVFESNTTLNELSSTLGLVQSSMTEYLNMRTSDSMENYYRYEEDYEDMLANLNNEIVDSQNLILERNIRRVSEEYLRLTRDIIEAKRGGNVEKYRGLYDEAKNLYTSINTMIYSLNNEQFKKNTVSYKAMSDTMSSLEGINLMTLVVIGLANMTFIILIASAITNPLRHLADAANKVAQGDFDLEPIPVVSKDEIAVVSQAFNSMVGSIDDYIKTIRINMDTERQMKEKELLMETHLKDARLKYLQAQINPHFLFNTLNAGAQMAMMEGADRTNEYIQKVADFFRYNIKKDHDSVTIGEELELVETYIYIINVRFSGEIHFDMNIADESLLKYYMPSMILQPIVENSVNYGVRDVEWESHIKLDLYRMEDTICSSIADNGVGMSQELINKILTRGYAKSEEETDSNGVGLNNVINRLELYFKEEDIMSIESEGPGKGTKTTIYLPMRDKNV